MALWTPSAIATALWLDASDASTLFDATSGGNFVAPGGAIARWEDKSGNGRHFTQSTLGNRPLRAVANENSLNVVSFDGTSHRLLNTTAALLRNISGYSVYFAGKSTTVGATEQTAFQVFTSSSNSRFIAVKLITTGFARIGGRRIAANSFAGIDGISHVNQSAIWSGVVNHSTTTLTGWINGTQFGNNTSFQTIGSTENDAGDAYIGGSGIATNFWAGTIFEIVVVHSAASVSDRQTIEGYLAWKWGLQANLPASHPYKFAAPGARFRSSFSTRYTYAPPTGARRRRILTSMP